MRVLVTGAAGFIGYHVTRRLLETGHTVLGVDNFNSYYDPSLKQARLREIANAAAFAFLELDIAHRGDMETLFAGTSFDVVVHLAAQAGVRYSLENPHVYAEANLTGFLHILEGVRKAGIGHLVYASSSSVYGENTKVPFSVADRVDRPVSLYAATKRANELMAHCYTHLFGMATTGLRFFTVYGPWGRPDMAPMKFARAILRGDSIDVYNYGEMKRDFTYVDDIAEGVVRAAILPGAGYRLFNVGNSAPIGLMDFIGALETSLGRTAVKRFLPLQAGDVVATHADVEDFWQATGFRPSTPLSQGIARFADWYLRYYQHQEQSPVEVQDSKGKADHEHGTHTRARAVLQSS